MTTYQAESFYRGKISTTITDSQACPFTIRVTKLPSLANGLVTISPNTENEEICEYDNPNATDSTIDIIKRWIKPSCVLLTTAGVDYNNATYYHSHTKNDVIRGDVNHIHLNQGIGNTTLATEVGVGIVRLATAPASPSDPIVVGDNDPRLWARVAAWRVDLTSATTTTQTYNVGFRPKRVTITATRGSSLWATSTSVTYDGWTTYTVYGQEDTGGILNFRHDTQTWVAWLLRNASWTLILASNTVTITATWFQISWPSWTWATAMSFNYECIA